MLKLDQDQLGLCFSLLAYLLPEALVNLFLLNKCIKTMVETFEKFAVF